MPEWRFLCYIQDSNFYMKRTVSCFLCALFFLMNGNAEAQSANKPKAVLNHLAIYVTNLQRTVDFYSNVFQLDTIPEPFHDNKHAWYSIAPGVALHVIAGADQPKEYFLNNHMCFSVNSVDAFVEKIKARKISWVNAKGEPGLITTRVDGVKQIWVNDPDGYFIEVNDAR
jgi:lactoylglutathione lyase